MGEETEEVTANKKEEVWLSFKYIDLRLNYKHTIDYDQGLMDLHIYQFCAKAAEASIP